MLEGIQSDREVGVIIGRFHLPDLHDGHRQFIDSIVRSHKEVILFLGSTKVKISGKNSLSYDIRKKMIQSEYPTVKVFKLDDNKSDEKWSTSIDNVLNFFYPNSSIILYGSRDSFLGYYSGKFDTSRLECMIDISGTEIRKSIVSRNTSDFRAGIIFAAQDRYPISYQTVDIAVFNDDHTKILLGRKPAEDKFRLFGGFVDVTDNSLEDAAVRELFEESSIQQAPEQLIYFGSYRIDDWRYEFEIDKIMTTVFSTTYIESDLQIPEASDDISEIKWFNVEHFNLDNIEPEHQQIIKHLLHS